MGFLAFIFQANPHEILTIFNVGILLAMQNIKFTLCKKTGNAGYQPFPIGTLNQKYDCAHGLS
jgi:hypothetical protein